MRDEDSRHLLDRALEYRLLHKMAGRVCLILPYLDILGELKQQHYLNRNNCYPQ